MHSTWRQSGHFELNRLVLQDTSVEVSPPQSIITVHKLNIQKQYQLCFDKSGWPYLIVTKVFQLPIKTTTFYNKRGAVMTLQTVQDSEACTFNIALENLQNPMTNKISEANNNKIEGAIYI